MQMPTLNLLDATAHVFQFLLVIMLMFALLFILAIMFRGFFSLLSGIVVMPSNYQGAKSQNVPETNYQPQNRLFTFREGSETHKWQSF